MLRPLIISLVCLALAAIPGVALFRPGHQGGLIQQHPIVPDALKSSDPGAGGVEDPAAAAATALPPPPVRRCAQRAMEPSPFMRSCFLVSDACVDQVGPACSSISKPSKVSLLHCWHPPPGPMIRLPIQSPNRPPHRVQRTIILHGKEYQPDPADPRGHPGKPLPHLVPPPRFYHFIFRFKNSVGACCPPPSNNSI